MSVHIKVRLLLTETTSSLDLLQTNYTYISNLIIVLLIEFEKYFLLEFPFQIDRKVEHGMPSARAGPEWKLCILRHKVSPEKESSMEDSTHSEAIRGKQMISDCKHVRCRLLHVSCLTGPASMTGQERQQFSIRDTVSNGCRHQQLKWLKRFRKKEKCTYRPKNSSALSQSQQTRLDLGSFFHNSSSRRTSSRNHSRETHVPERIVHLFWGTPRRRAAKMKWQKQLTEWVFLAPRTCCTTQMQRV